MNNLYQQMQHDVMGTANNMMTQLVCQEKGIDYNQLMYQAQQQHLNNIMQAEQQRQMMQVVKRHYQGNGGSFISKIKEVFSPEPATPFMPMPNMFPGQPQQYPSYVGQSQPHVQQQLPVPQQQTAYVPPQDAATVISSQSFELDTHKRLRDMENMISDIAQTLHETIYQQQQQQPPVQYQGQPPVNFGATQQGPTQE